MPKYMVFSKHLSGPPLEESAARLRDVGVEAIDLTVRPKGHVDPERVQDELPKMRDLLRKAGSDVGMLTTNIIDISKTNAAILETAAKLGVKFIKLGYWEYAGFGKLHEQRAEVKARCNDISYLCADLGITAGFHNHSDVYIGASPWDIEHAIRETPKAALGLYWDPAHATIEGGSSVWEQGLDLLSDRLVMLAVKDFRWANGKHRYAGGRIHSMEFCPLELGNTPWQLAIKRQRQLKFDGPISFHSEYQGQFSWKDLTVEEVIEQTKRDVTLFKQWWDEATA